MKTVLFAWELGAGAGHLVNIRRLAQRLQRDDIRLVAAVMSLEFIQLLDNVPEIHRMPAWPKPRTDGPPSSATMTDNLVGAGMNDASAVYDIVAAWERLFQGVKPSLVICDYAPGASLAARGRIPVMHIGGGYTLPPHDLERFPALHELSPVVNRDELTLSVVNDAVRRLGLRSLERLPQLFAGDGRLVYVLPLIDPYLSIRNPPADGPMIDYDPRGRDGDAQDIFVYIAGDTEVRADLIAALRPVARHARIYAPRLSEQAQRELARDGARIMTSHVALAEALPRCRLVVHLGGGGFANEFASRRCPATDPGHPCRTLSDRRGAGTTRASAACFKPPTRRADLPQMRSSSMLHDEALHHRAIEVANRLRAERPRMSAGERFDAECRRLLG